MDWSYLLKVNNTQVFFPPIAHTTVGIGTFFILHCTYISSILRWTTLNQSSCQIFFMFAEQTDIVPRWISQALCHISVFGADELNPFENGLRNHHSMLCTCQNLTYQASQISQAYWGEKVHVCDDKLKPIWLQTVRKNVSNTFCWILIIFENFRETCSPPRGIWYRRSFGIFIWPVHFFFKSSLLLESKVLMNEIFWHQIFWWVEFLW